MQLSEVSVIRRMEVSVICLFKPPKPCANVAHPQDHWMTHCGMEVILPNGELMRTGMGAMPDPTNGSNEGLRPDQHPPNRSWQLFNYGFGPYNDGVFTQSSLGITTKLGVWVGPPCHTGTHLSRQETMANALTAHA